MQLIFRTRQAYIDLSFLFVIDWICIAQQQIDIVKFTTFCLVDR